MEFNFTGGPQAVLSAAILAALKMGVSLLEDSEQTDC